MSAQVFDLAIFDLDGVVTRTASVHAAAWKRLFDEVLLDTCGPGFRPFDLQHDYLTYVDGRPRYDGVQAFLSSRAIDLPYGTPADAPGTSTICGLGNTKNGYFLAALEEHEVEVFDDTVDLLRRLRTAGVETAIVSASENCAAILERAGLSHLFDVRIDGVDIARDRIPGKPAPDTFLAAARRLCVDPAHAAVFEDALVGVEAGRAGRFALVVGVDRVGQGAAFLEHGADVFLDRLDGIRVDPLPSALSHLQDMVQRIPRPLVCLDYDGTLTPIVERPEQALLAPEMREVLRELAGLTSLAIVSGRDLEVVRGLVDLDVIYLADHGFELALPGKPVEIYEPAEAAVTELASVAAQAPAQLAQIPGVLIEPKRFSLAIHDRLVSDGDLPTVRQTVDRLLATRTSLRLVEGKRVHEFRPDVDWDKGKSVLWLATQIGAEADRIVYIGDDVTDEDVFHRLRHHGAGIVVMKPPRPTAAGYRLQDTDEVLRFLRQFTDKLSESA